MTQTPPAGWFPDPEDAAQQRYWDGTQWTEHRAPRTPTASDQLAKAGGEIADGLAKGFTAFGTWVSQQRTSTPTFASIAASCRDEPARQPLAVSTELVSTPGELAQVPWFGAPGTTVVCRLVPNPWDPATPTGVAVFVGPTQVGRLPADLEATWCPLLAPLASRGLVTTGTLELGTPSTVRLPEPAAFSES